MAAMMPKSILSALLAALALACTRGDSLAGASRSVGFGRNMLVTEYRIRDGRESALVHVLFVPQVESVENGGYGAIIAGADSVERGEIRYSFIDQGRRIRIEAASVVIVRDGVVQVGGRSFDLTRGNVFVAYVALNGMVTLRQVPRMLAAKETSPEEVLEAITGRR